MLSKTFYAQVIHVTNERTDGHAPRLMQSLRVSSTNAL